MTDLKFIAVLLVVVNVLLLSWWTGWLNLWDNREPERLRKQVEAERISVQAGAATPPAARTGGEGQTEPASSQGNPSSGPEGADKPAAPATPAGPAGTQPAVGDVAARAAAAGVTAAGAPATATATAPARACLEFPPMDTDKARAIEASMKQAGLTVEAAVQEAANSFMVLLPPSESTREAQRKLAELKRLGVADAYLMQEGPHKLGISLGVFRSEEGAKSLVQQLIGKGVRSARIAPGGSVRASKTVLKATGNDAQLTRVRQAATEVDLNLKACGN